LGYPFAPVLLIGKSFETFDRVDAYKRIGGLLNVPVKGGVLSKPVQGNVPIPKKDLIPIVIFPVLCPVQSD